MILTVTGRPCAESSRQPELTGSASSRTDLVELLDSTELAAVLACLLADSATSLRPELYNLARQRFKQFGALAI